MEGREPLLTLCGAYTHVAYRGDAIFSGLSPLPKGQVWDHNGLQESVHTHCHGDALDPTFCTADVMLSRKLLNARLWIKVGRGPVAAWETFAGGQYPKMYNVHHKWVVVGLRRAVTGCGVLGAYLLGGHGPSPG